MCWPLAVVYETNLRYYNITYSTVRHYRHLPGQSGVVCLLATATALLVANSSLLKAMMCVLCTLTRLECHHVVVVVM